MQLTILQGLEQILRQAFNQFDIPENIAIDLQQASRPEFGDYQVNGLIAAAKLLRQNPRQLATQVSTALAYNPQFSKIEIAGPGFINLTIEDKYLASQLSDRIFSINLPIGKTTPSTIIVDYSSPNLAKEMHVGHLRSTIIGDALVRTYEYLGHKVIRRNHVGDWGTQFGMLTAYLTVNQQSYSQEKLSDLEHFYRQAKLAFDQDPEFAARSREYVVRLQAKDPEIIQLWQDLVTVSLSHCQHIYDRLQVKLNQQDIYGESYYHDSLAPLVERLMQQGIAIESLGAKCVFFSPAELAIPQPPPLILQKQDGAYLYATTDLAALYDRVTNLQAQRIVYVIDSRQSLHMQQIFATARKADLVAKDTILEHVAFGTMLGEDKKPFKTRSGATIKLDHLLDIAVARAQALLHERQLLWPDYSLKELANTLAIAAIKYADLTKNRLSDYTFCLDKMLAFEGNTAPYILYAYTRIISVFKKSQLNPMKYLTQPTITISTSLEHKLALQISQFKDKVLQVARENYPHYLCNYIYELAGTFMQFYETSPILTADCELKTSRLALAALTAQAIKIALNLLGIAVVDRM